MHALPTNDMRAEITVWTLPIAFLAKLLWQIEHNRYWQTVVLARQREQRLAGFGIDIGSIDDGESTGGEPPGGDEVQHRKGVVAGTLIVFIIRDQATTEVRREHLGWLKVIVGNGGLAGS